MKKGILTSLGLAAVLTLGLVVVNEYRSNVVDAEVENTSTLSFADKAERIEFSTTKQVWSQNGITLTNNKGSSTTAIADYANPVRIYKSSDVVIEAEMFTKITFESAANDASGEASKNYLDNLSSIFGDAAVVDGTTVTVELDGPVSSYSFTASVGQIRFYSVSVTHVSDLYIALGNKFSKYYGDGNYVKSTKINVKGETTDEVKSCFHAGVSKLERITYYQEDALWMENGTGYSYYGTSGSNMTNGKVASVGETSESIAYTGKTMDQYYVTLNDFVKGENESIYVEENESLKNGWSYENGVYTSDDESVIDAFRLFTAPLWLNESEQTANYIQYEKVTVEEVDNTLVLKLHINPTNSGLLVDGSNNVFSVAYIEKGTAHTYHVGNYVEVDSTHCKLDCFFCDDTTPVEHTGGQATTESGPICELCGNEYGEPLSEATVTYSYEFTSKQFTANETKTLGGISWTLSGDGSYWGYDTQYGKGQQFGSGSKPYKSLALVSTGFAGKQINEIIINTSGASSTAAKLVVKVGGQQVYSATITASAKDYTINCTGYSGEITFEYTQTAKKAIYIKSISVTYVE